MYETTLMSSHEWSMLVASPATKRAEGYHCAKMKLPRADNPHPVGSVNHKWWDEGWALYETERLGKEEDAQRR